MQTWQQRARARIQELALKQDTLANDIGVTRGAIGHYLSGRREPSLRKLEKLAYALKVSPCWLVLGLGNCFDFIENDQ